MELCRDLAKTANDIPESCENPHPQEGGVFLGGVLPEGGETAEEGGDVRLNVFTHSLHQDGEDE